MKDVIKALLADLDALGFSDQYTPVAGSDCVDVVATHIDALRKAVEPPVKKKFTLIIKMYTDDDAMIEYDNHLYCYYRMSLKISEQFDNLVEIEKFIKEKIYVHEGYKATNMTNEWLTDCANSIILNGEPASDVCGNQEYSMDIINNNPLTDCLAPV